MAVIVSTWQAPEDWDVGSAICRWGQPHPEFMEAIGSQKGVPGHLLSESIHHHSKLADTDSASIVTVAHLEGLFVHGDPAPDGPQALLLLVQEHVVHFLAAEAPHRLCTQGSQMMTHSVYSCCTFRLAFTVAEPLRGLAIWGLCAPC